MPMRTAVTQHRFKTVKEWNAFLASHSYHWNGRMEQYELVGLHNGPPLRLYWIKDGEYYILYRIPEYAGTDEEVEKLLAD